MDFICLYMWKQIFMYISLSFKKKMYIYEKIDMIKF